MLRGWRLRARWPAPIHPELAAHLRAGVSCSYFKLCAEPARVDRSVSREKKRLRKAPEARDEREAKGSAGRGARSTATISGSVPARRRPDRLGRAKSAKWRRPGKGFGGVAQNLGQPRGLLGKPEMS